MEKLNKSSLLFLAELLNCIIDDVNITLLLTDDAELSNLLDTIKPKLLIVYQRVNNFNIRRNENEK